MTTKVKPGRSRRVSPILLVEHGRPREDAAIPVNHRSASAGRSSVQRSWARTWFHRGGAVSALAVLLMFALAPPASADGEGETDVGYLLVQQALGHLAHDTSHEGMALAMEKVEDALVTENQDGVDVATLEEAKNALEDEQVDTARTLLQASIRDALDDLPPATGEETGSTVIVPALDTREGISGSDWSFIGVSVLALMAGVLLAFRFRPADTVRDLRRRMDGGQ